MMAHSRDRQIEQRPDRGGDGADRQNFPPCAQTIGEPSCHRRRQQSDSRPGRKDQSDLLRRDVARLDESREKGRDDAERRIQYRVKDNEPR